MTLKIYSMQIFNKVVNSRPLKNCAVVVIDNGIRNNVAAIYYKETLIGVRSVRENVGFFLDIATHTTGNQLYSPTLDQLTEQHIKEAVDEIDRSNEKTGYMPIGEIAPKGQELLAREMSILIDKRLTDEG